MGDGAVAFGSRAKRLPVTTTSSPPVCAGCSGATSFCAPVAVVASPGTVVCARPAVGIAQASASALPTSSPARVRPVVSEISIIILPRANTRPTPLARDRPTLFLSLQGTRRDPALDGAASAPHCCGAERLTGDAPVVKRVRSGPGTRRRTQPLQAASPLGSAAVAVRFERLRVHSSICVSTWLVKLDDMTKLACCCPLKA